jgi:hypothetical protein
MSQAWEAQWEAIINKRIQAAVNDALERAAQVAEEWGEISVADVIRGLKTEAP